MKKLMSILAAGVFVAASVQGQEYKVSKSTGTLAIREVNHVTVEGHSGSEIIFSSRNHTGRDDERAKGLRALSSMGLEDNSGLGLSVVEKGNVIEVQQLKKTEGPKVKILVPKGVKVVYSHTSPYGHEIEINNFPGVVEVNTVHNGVVLNNTTGEVSVKTVHGDIDAVLASGPGASVTLESIHGHVDVAVPVSTKSNLTVGTHWGEVLVDPDFKIEMDRSGNLVNYSNKIRGKLNGGGAPIALTSQHNNVYLRKK